jgi:KRAB domain-containing zinc finger protein
VQRLTDEQLLALQTPNSVCSQSHECLLCGVHLKSAKFLKSHADLHTTPIAGEIKCAVGKCTLIFSSSEKLKQHRKVHFQALQFSCDVCGNLSTNKHNLQLHMKSHSQLRPHACDVPGCSFSGKIADSLNKHKKNVHSSILYTCLLCGKNIKSYENHKNHVASHNTKTPGVIKCRYGKCKKLFQNAGNLRKHIKEAHEDNKQLKCNTCGKCFAVKGSLAIHVITHWDWRPFKCDTPSCSYSAKRSKDHLIALRAVTVEICSEAEFISSNIWRNTKQTLQAS